jgi:hypothetical protein
MCQGNTVEPRFYIPVTYIFLSFAKKFSGPISFTKFVMYFKHFSQFTPFLLGPFKSVKGVLLYFEIEVL